MRTINATIAPGEARVFDVAAAYFEVLTLTGADFIDAIEFATQGAMLSRWDRVLPGFYGRETFDRFTITNSGPTAFTIDLMIAGTEAGNRGQTTLRGTVSVKGPAWRGLPAPVRTLDVSARAAGNGAVLVPPTCDPVTLAVGESLVWLVCMASSDNPTEAARIKDGWFATLEKLRVHIEQSPGVDVEIFHFKTSTVKPNGPTLQVGAAFSTVLVFPNRITPMPSAAAALSWLGLTAQNGGQFAPASATVGNGMNAPCERIPAGTVGMWESIADHFTPYLIGRGAKTAINDVPAATQAEHSCLMIYTKPATQAAKLSISMALVLHDMTAGAPLG